MSKKKSDIEELEVCQELVVLCTVIGILSDMPSGERQRIIDYTREFFDKDRDY